MDKKALLEKLKDSLKESESQFESKEAVICWANKLVPYLKKIDPEQHHIFNINLVLLHQSLSSQMLIPAFNQMKGCLEIAIGELQLTIEEEQSLLDQYSFPANSQLDIQIVIAKVIEQATKSLWIQDPYMDEKIVNELVNVNAIDIKLLTSNKNNSKMEIFKQRLSASKQQFPAKKIDAKISDSFHDRSYIIDEEQVWQLTGSYKDSGKKPITLMKIKSEIDSQRFITEFNTYWNDATELP